MVAEASRRTAAALSLAFLAAAFVLAVVTAIGRFPHGLAVLACLVVAVALIWWVLPRSRPARAVGGLIAGALLIVAVVLIFTEGALLADLLIVAAICASMEFARRAFRVHAELPSAPPPQRPILFYNPKSGDGKAERFHVADEAKKRGIEARELKRGDDLVELVEAAVRDGADALAMAGGDGSQAIVAAAAAKHGLPYACIPSGTRNHFALDLGVDRDDVVGALDAFVDGRERVVDLAEINGRVFVNNVSIGIYADAVQSEAYRGAKVRTLLEMAPQSLGAENGDSFHWRGPSGDDQTGAAVLMVSNDPYRLGRLVGSNTRPRMDLGTLGIAMIPAAQGRVEQWSAPTFEVTADKPVAVGVDGEALRLDPPLEFRSRPRVLHVRIAAQHPGASPSAAIPDSPVGVLRELSALALGRS
jgi:diacylglycerol kinase family enzyme